ncbi:TetR/AcrR family transcriptional regulator [Parapedobacter sp. SGR-10]|mgnify:CR=1 FL=1|uniref:TetR/AcrR family transcriptional regulator n=1 Tax=Parapedobacter sp. SGR-10 TaxID=2710879 RepID=UPI0013D3CA4C|nr:TetR/AcrR family transcriptional regulator [Parapedobacter sp. SGR-10]NGF56638.1 TetR/AcrR family transcriptional regulator [Parapedobacter sp. SGR-10]
MPKNADEKRNKILEVAKRRFAHYGMAKTTMAEIAKDLSFSKALLYYYFPDKNSLYSAVLEFIIDEFGEELQEYLQGFDNVEDSILALLQKRIEFIKRYYYIIEFSLLSRKEISEDMEKTFICAFEMHRQAVEGILRKGMERGELGQLDVEECSKLFLFATMGLRLMATKDLKSDFLPSKEDFDYIVGMQQKLAKIFIKGLKA